MASSLAAETEAQSRWRLKPSAAGAQRLFDQLVEYEFMPPHVMAAKQGKRLQRLVRVAAAFTPFYREKFAACGISPREILRMEDLPRLPVLEKPTLRDQFKSLHAEQLPDGETFGGYSVSSGTTGPPTRVAITSRARQMFAILKQRECRWFRFDPAELCAHIRIQALPTKPDGSRIDEGETLELDGWPLIGNLFETGPFIGFKRTNTVDECLDWLRRKQPRYLTSSSIFLDWLALAAADGKGVDDLKATVAISEQVTPGMRKRIAARLGASVEENYGLNEVGIVAVRCPEAGRYHTHVEQAILEIVDDAGTPVAPGDTGRILVTSLINFAMPLIRYFTGDLARATEGPCPCGRALPSFEGPILRERRIAPLPPGSRELSEGLLIAMEGLPEPLLRTIRSYQLHESLEKSYTLKLCPNRDPAPKLVQNIERAWASLAPDDVGRLTIETMDRLPERKNGKVFLFTSEFIDPDDAAAER